MLSLVVAKVARIRTVGREADGEGADGGPESVGGALLFIKVGTLS